MSTAPLFYLDAHDEEKSFITDTWNTSSALELSAISALDEPEKSKFFLRTIIRLL
jgi:hypothetical protein